MGEVGWVHQVHDLHQVHISYRVECGVGWAGTCACACTNTLTWD